MTIMQSKKDVASTLVDLRFLFTKYKIEDWEPIPEDGTIAYAVRYRQGGQWVMISSRVQPTRAQNLRQCYQVIQYLFLWAARGVGGMSQGVTFIHGGLVPVGNVVHKDTLAEAYATIGVDAACSLDEIRAVYAAKIRYNHPDVAKDSTEKRGMEGRTGRLNEAWARIQKARVG